MHRPSISISRRTSNSSPPSPSSPLSQPPYFPSSPDMSDDTPSPFSPVTPAELADDMPGIVLDSDHSTLASFAQYSDSARFLEKAGHRNVPLLPPHHPLRSKMYASNASGAEVPSRPLSYTIHPSGARHDATHKSKQHLISNPVGLSIHMPRRVRTYIVFAVCCLFGLYFFNSAKDRKNTSEVFSRQQAAELARRRDEMLGLRNGMALKIDRTGTRPTPHAPLTFSNTHDELSALLAFITSTTSNALPHLDPLAPIDPAIVLDFDPARADARLDLDLLVEQVNTVYPLVLYGKLRDPWHREVKAMLAEYKITPAPLIVDVDQRRDHDVFVPLLARLLDSEELPQLVLRGRTLGSYHDLLEKRDTGSLGDLLEEGGLTVRDQKAKKGVKERERNEMERILGPAPIRDT